MRPQLPTTQLPALPPTHPPTPRSYVALGWAALPFVQRFHEVLPAADVGLIVCGGVVYSLGVRWVIFF